MQKNRNTNSDEMKQKSRLKIAVNATSDVKGNFHTGLGAIKNCDKQRFQVSEPRKILGSLDIDTSTKHLYPQDNRWDYAVEYDGDTFFIEIHPGSTRDVDVVITKLDWLKKWLKHKAPCINALKPKDKNPYYWVYTKRYTILRNSRYERLLAQKNLKPIRQLNFDLL